MGLLILDKMHLKKILRCLRNSDEPPVALDTIGGKEVESQSESAPERGSQWLQFAAAMSGKSLIHFADSGIGACLVELALVVSHSRR